VKGNGTTRKDEREGGRNIRENIERKKETSDNIKPMHARRSETSQTAGVKPAEVQLHIGHE
jgi:hypothetical protein